MSKEFLLEPDIIAATENVLPDLNNDLILAKNFLKQQSAATGDSLYDHLVDLIQKILTHKPPDIVDYLEQYSWQVKLEKFRPNFDLLNDMYLSPPQLEEVQRTEEMYRLLADKQKKSDNMGAEEQELDLEEDSMRPRISDFVEHNYYFREGGFGLPDEEAYAVYVALNMLGIKEPVATVRFFGKIYGLKANYYVAETTLTIEELDRRIREFELKDMPGEGEGEDEMRPPVEEEREELLGEGEVDERGPKEPVPPKLPPTPVSTWQPAVVIPVERPGQGANKKVYWVVNKPGDDWICLPDVTPAQIKVARLTVHAMTGDLDAELLMFPPFDGRERNYLRAQIARIAAGTSVSPQGFFTYGSGEEEEDVDLEEGAGDMDFNANPYFQGHSLKDLLDSNLTYWVHHSKYILKQGRTQWWVPNAEMDEAAEEEEDEVNAVHEPPEHGPPLFNSLAEDARIEGLPAWSPRISSTMLPDRAVAVLRCNIWPGAVAYSTSGKQSECLYVGWGLKFQPPNFSPLQLPKPRDEYPVGPEVMEMADPTLADEEAYRIAHLPPVPPPPVYEGGEDFGEEIEDEEED